MGVGEAANFAAFGFIPAMLVTTLGALSVIVRWVAGGMSGGVAVGVDLGAHNIVLVGNQLLLFLQCHPGVVYP